MAVVQTAIQLLIDEIDAADERIRDLVNKEPALTSDQKVNGAHPPEAETQRH